MKPTAKAKKAATRKPAAEKSARNVAKPEAAKDAPEKARSLARTTGEALVRLLERARGSKVQVKNGQLAGLAAQLANGTEPKDADLVTLRDGINDVAAALRERDETDLARELSTTNRFVRRLERAARKA